MFRNYSGLGKMIALAAIFLLPPGAFAQTQPGTLDRLLGKPTSIDDAADQSARREGKQNHGAIKRTDDPAHDLGAKDPYGGADRTVFQSLDKNDRQALEAFRILFPDSPLAPLADGLVQEMRQPAPSQAKDPQGTKSPNPVQEEKNGSQAAEHAFDEPNCIHEWQLVAQSCAASQLEAFLSICPDTPAAQMAERRKLAIGRGQVPKCRISADTINPANADQVHDSSGNRATAAEQNETRFELSRRERAQVQQYLNALGYKSGPVDADFGKRTRAAIRRFEKANGFPETGYLNAERHQRLTTLGRPAFKEQQTRLEARKKANAEQRERERVERERQRKTIEQAPEPTNRSHPARNAADSQTTEGVWSPEIAAEALERGIRVEETGLAFPDLSPPPSKYPVPINKAPVGN